ncbi:MAG: hypothetical protein UT66_C0035G0023 [candidate division CPR2 bacterium GW2011_GWC1_39_9]|uniref:Uncharacterized protein n=1 Tax=candidate division CPR2 bacterium GW2011_GWC2_39_10 TaxID=1618345 RepID=A0A0G0LPA5_UNCC2|nr:MAG: hypothetical protein UT18_C0016G0004 [candidate division CPR2 bacterium GW2011_GWC2_39_10]KKR33690.1 MAG: hypothetical protein UT66_C0035G0023 [candidate division CPR2 bacterium GW2011_GWC1_39_9]
MNRELLFLLGAEESSNMEKADRLISERITDFLRDKIDKEGFDVSELKVPGASLAFNEVTKEDDPVLYRLREIMKIVCEEMDLNATEAFSVASESLIDIKVYVMRGNDFVREMKQAYIDWHRDQNKLTKKINFLTSSIKSVFRRVFKRRRK